MKVFIQHFLVSKGGFIIVFADWFYSLQTASALGFDGGGCCHCCRQMST